MGNKLTPEVRFAGFIDEWEERKLGDIVNVIDGDRGKNYPSGNELMEIGHTAFLNANNVTKNGFLLEKMQYITELKSNLMGNGKVDIGDTILTSRGTVGNTAYYNDYIKGKIPYARINSGMLILRPTEDIYPGYVTQYLKASVGEKQMKSIIFGSAQPQLTKRDITNFEILIPGLTEQKRISFLIELLDNITFLHQQELTTLKQTKQGFLQKMFPKEGESVPEVRFSGFTEKWQKCKLKELGEIQTGSTPPTANADNYSKDGMIWVTPTDITNIITRITAKRLSKIGQLKARIVKPGTILVTSIASIGKNTIVEELASFNQQIHSLTPNNKNDSYFLLTQSDLWSAKMKNSAASGTMQIVNKKDFSNIFTLVPRKDEQIEIGNFFKHLDDIITLHQQELDALQETKKAFLQKMFV